MAEPLKRRVDSLLSERSLVLNSTVQRLLLLLNLKLQLLSLVLDGSLFDFFLFLPKFFDLLLDIRRLLLIRFDLCLNLLFLLIDGIRELCLDDEGLDLFSGGSW